MIAKIKAIYEILKLLWITYQWASEKIDDIAYYSEKNKRMKLIKAIGSGDLDAELEALEELGK